MGVKTDLRSRLIQEAIRLLSEKPADVTLRGLARAAGVSAMAPYRHFADKAALMRAVTEAGFNRLRMVLLEADSAGDDRSALIAQGLAYIAFAVANPALFRLMFSEAEYEKSEAGPGDDTAYGVLSRRIAQIAPGETTAAVHRCLGDRPWPGDLDAGPPITRSARPRPPGAHILHQRNRAEQGLVTCSEVVRR